MIDLAAEFQAPARDDWMDQVAPVLLRGTPDAGPEALAAAFSRRLVHHTDDGIEVQPLYTRDDAVDAGLPGVAPFVRGNESLPTPWEVRQRVWAGPAGVTAATELESGATGLLIELGSDATRLEAALEGVLLDLVPVAVSADDQVGAARALLGEWERARIAPAERRGCLGLDPLGRHAASGGANDLDADMTDAVAVVRDAAAAAPAARALVADGTVFHEAGATPAQEVAWTTLAGAEYVRALVAAGIDLDAALRSLEFRWSATDDQFETIAKLRSARRVWARVAELAGASPADCAQFQHADTARSMLTQYDPWVNALRSTVACFAAGVGGAGAVTVIAHDHTVTPGGSDLGRRLARNTQTILQMESNLCRVADMAGGSWYVESLTDQLAERAWQIVREVEQQGGVVAALRSGAIQAQVTAAVDGRRHEVATRARPLTGLTEFPDLAETLDPVPTAAAPPRGDFAPLVPQRVGDEVEAVRARADAHAQSSGSRPTVYLATLGPEAVYTPRVTFAQNFFGVGGIVAVPGEVEAYDPTISPLVCLCSSDAEYGTRGATAAVALRDAGASAVYLAGRGLELDGVDHEIGLGSDMVTILTSVLDQLEVPS